MCNGVERSRASMAVSSRGPVWFHKISSRLIALFAVAASYDHQLRFDLLHNILFLPNPNTISSFPHPDHDIFFFLSDPIPIRSVSHGIHRGRRRFDSPLPRVRSPVMATKTQVKSSSTCHPPETTQGARIFDILGYSKHRGMGPTAFIRSAVFNVAGYNWVIFFYPDGFTDESAGGGFDFVSAYLRLLTTNRGKVRASCDLRLVNPTTSKATSVHPTLVTTMREYDPDGDKNKVFNCMCIGRAQLEGTYVKNDRLTMECVTVAAHWVVLAMRSPVFKADLYGPMREVVKEAIVIEDMQPDIFRVMLCFIYTNSMDRNDDLGRDYHCRNCDMVQHLLVAADRVILAARSPVFEVELYGPMTMEMDTICVEVDDMRPGVFRALLHFVYTNSLPVMDDLGDDEMKGLVAAAER
nr:unnamed protein product [Digitaria exilis]